jgi:hypothetical protein
MSRENDVYTVLNADATLLTTLTGGIFKVESIGIDGIDRTSAPTAFTGGFLRPCALVRSRSFVPDGVLRDNIAKQLTVRETVEVYLYSDGAAGYSAIDTAKARVIRLLQGHQFADSFEVELVNIVPRMREPAGPLMNASMERLDFLVVSVWG